MKRTEIEKTYKVVQNKIVSPGKFEGCPVFAPYFWEMFLNGFADDDTDEILTFEITEEDRKEFPETNLDYARFVKIRTDDNGFIYCTTTNDGICK